MLKEKVCGISCSKKYTIPNSYIKYLGFQGLIVKFPSKAFLLTMSVFHSHHEYVSKLNNLKSKVFPEIYPKMSLSISFCFLTFLFFSPSLSLSTSCHIHKTYVTNMTTHPSPPYPTKCKCRSHNLPTCLNLFYFLHEHCFSSLEMKFTGRLVHLMILFIVDMYFSQIF